MGDMMLMEMEQEGDDARPLPTSEEVEEWIKPANLVAEAKKLADLFLDQDEENYMAHASFYGMRGMVLAAIEMPDTSEKRGKLIRQLILKSEARAYVLMFEGWRKSLSDKQMQERGLLGHPDWEKPMIEKTGEPSPHWMYNKPLTPELGKLWNIPTVLNTFGMNCKGDHFMLMRTIDSTTRETIDEDEACSWDATNWEMGGELVIPVPDRELVGLEREVYLRMAFVPPPEFREKVMAADGSDPRLMMLKQMSEDLGFEGPEC